MQDLNRALGDISSIRRQMAQSTEFRGYGPATLAMTGVFAAGAAGLQAVWLPGLAGQAGAGGIADYLGIWMGTALVSAALIGVQTANRARRMHSGLADAMIRMAVEQFLPAAAAGVLVTLVLVRCVPGAVWMLPGLWQIIYSLGVFASCRGVYGS